MPAAAYTGAMKVVAVCAFILGWSACGWIQPSEGTGDPVAAEQPGASDDRRPRARELGIRIGTLPPGPGNSITDIEGVAVGHATIRRGENVRTGVTVILPHGGNLYRKKVQAAIAVANGYGKLVGTTQVKELGEIESPIALTNTLSVGRVMDGLVGHMLAVPGNERVRSVNVVVGETNDGRLNDIRGRHVTTEHVEAALRNAGTGTVAEGAVGAGTGTVCFGFKGGIGTSSRRVGAHTVGVLVQSNYGGRLTVAGIPFTERSRSAPRRQRDEDGSCMIVVATDAPLRSRNLERLAHRAFAGMARTGASFSNGSGDYSIAFSTQSSDTPFSNAKMSGLFRAVAEATEEAIVNSLCAAVTTTGCGRTVEAIPVARLREMFAR